MPLNINSLVEIPQGALRVQAQTDGTFIVYMPGDTLPPAPAEQPSAPAIPQAITARQAKSAILLAGWLGATDEQVEANGYLLFDSMPEPNRSLGRIAWRESNDFQRDNPLVIAMLQALGKTPQQGDALFVQGATL